MATSMIRHVFFRNTIIKSVLNSLNAQRIGKRHLFSEERIGLDRYINARKKEKERLGSLKVKFCQQLEDIVSSSDSGVILPDDLYTMIHITESDADLELLDKVTKRYFQEDGLRSINYRHFDYGPLLLRLLHLLNKPDIAVRYVTDEELGDAFKHIWTKIVLMDLLYKNQRYQDVVDISRIELPELMSAASVEEDDETTPNKASRQTTEVGFLYLAALYKINTPEALELAITFMKDYMNQHNITSVPTRFSEFTTMLALNQNEPVKAMQFVSLKSDVEINTDLINFKVLAYIQLRRYYNILLVMTSMVKQDTCGSASVKGLFSDVITRAHELFQNCDDDSAKKQFKVLKTALETGKLIYDSSLEDFVNRPVAKRKYQFSGQNLIPFDLNQGQDRVKESLEIAHYKKSRSIKKRADQKS